MFVFLVLFREIPEVRCMSMGLPVPTCLDYRHGTAAVAQILHPKCLPGSTQFRCFNGWSMRLKVKGLERV